MTFEDRDQRPEARVQSPETGMRHLPSTVICQLPSVFRLPSSALRPLSSNSRSGQAAIELVAGLLLLLLVLTGLIHVNRMARTSLFLHAVLRGDAGEQAMEDTALSAAPLYISDWQAGADGVRYTADDQPVRNGAFLSSTLSTLTQDSVKNADDWSYVTDLDRLPTSMVQLNASPAMAATLGFVHREETLHVPVDPVLRQLVYGKDEVAIKEEVWMPLMGGLY